MARVWGLHVFAGAAVACRGQAILILGDSGSGRAALVESLLEAGCTLLSRDGVWLDVDRQIVVQSATVEGPAGSAAATPTSLAGFTPTVALYAKGFRVQGRLQPLAPVRALFEMLDAFAGDTRHRAALALGLAGLFARLKCYDAFVGPAEETARSIGRTVAGRTTGARCVSLPRRSSVALARAKAGAARAVRSARCAV